MGQLLRGLIVAVVTSERRPSTMCARTHKEPYDPSLYNREVSWEEGEPGHRAAAKYSSEQYSKTKNVLYE